MNESAMNAPAGAAKIRLYRTSQAVNFADAKSRCGKESQIYAFPSVARTRVAVCVCVCVCEGGESLVTSRAEHGSLSVILGSV